jgi:IclR family acetate operon transcriptional repressor
VERNLAQTLDTTTSERATTVRSVERALKILSLLAHGQPEYTLDDVSAQLQLPKSTVHRLLHTLTESGFVERGMTGGSYRLGVGAVRIGSIANRGRVSEALYQLRDLTQETVGLVTLERDEAVILSRALSRHPLRYNLHEGTRLPAHCTSSGKVLLSQLPLETVELLYGGSPLPRFTERTVSSYRELLAQLSKVRANGFAVDDQEYAEGLRCLSVPIALGPSSLYALGIAGAAARLSVEGLMSHLPAIRAAADTISDAFDRFGDGYGD